MFSAQCNAMAADINTGDSNSSRTLVVLKPNIMVTAVLLLSGAAHCVCPPSAVACLQLMSCGPHKFNLLLGCWVTVPVITALLTAGAATVSLDGYSYRGGGPA